LNGGITWTGKDQAAAKDYINTTYAISNTGTGVVSIGLVNLVASATDADGFSNNFAFRFQNTNAGGTLNVGFVTASDYTSSTVPANKYHGILSLENGGVASIAGGNYLGFLNNNTPAAGTLTVTGATSVAGVLTNNGAGSLISLGTSALTLSGSVAHLTVNGVITATTPGGLFVTSTGTPSFNGGTLSNLTMNGAAGVLTLGGAAATMQDVNVLAGTIDVTVGTVGTPTLATGTTTVNGGTFIIDNNLAAPPQTGFYYKTTRYSRKTFKVTIRA
jgi:hypothetical protein